MRELVDALLPNYCQELIDLASTATACEHSVAASSVHQSTTY